MFAPAFKKTTNNYRINLLTYNILSFKKIKMLKLNTEYVKKQNSIINEINIYEILF